MSMFIGTLLERLEETAARLSREDFCDRHGGHYLVCEVSSESPEGEMDFYTGIVRADNIRRNGYDKASSRKAVGAGRFLVKVQKKPGSAWPNWFSIGRANNNDIVLRHPSVSKLHARLDTQGPIEMAESHGDSLWLTDMDSTKGTRLNGKPIENGGRYPLQLGDSLLFGDVAARFVDAGMLYDELSDAPR